MSLLLYKGKTNIRFNSVFNGTRLLVFHLSLSHPMAPKHSVDVNLEELTMSPPKKRLRSVTSPSEISCITYLVVNSSDKNIAVVDAILNNNIRNVSPVPFADPSSVPDFGTYL